MLITKERADIYEEAMRRDLGRPLSESILKVRKYQRSRRIYSDEVPMAENPRCLRNVCFRVEGFLTQDLDNTMRLDKWKKKYAIHNN